MIALAIVLAVVVVALLLRVGVAMWRDRREAALPVQWRDQQARSQRDDPR